MTTYEDRIEALTSKYGKSKRLDDGALKSFSEALSEKVDAAYALYDREHNIAPPLTRDDMRTLRRRDAMREHYARMDPKPAKVDRLGIEGRTVTTDGVRVKDAAFEPTARRNYLPRVFKVVCSDGVVRTRLVEPARLESIPCAVHYISESDAYVIPKYVAIVGPVIRKMTKDDLDMWTEAKPAHGYVVEGSDAVDLTEQDILEDEAREEGDDTTPFTCNQPIGRYYAVTYVDARRNKPLEIDYLGVLSGYKIWRTPTSFWESPVERKYWIGRIYLHNLAGAGGHQPIDLAETIGTFFGVEGRTVRNYAEFARTSDATSHDCFIKGTRIRVKRRVVLSGDWVLKDTYLTRRIVPWTTCDGFRFLKLWAWAGAMDMSYRARSQALRLLQREMDD